ncbi:MAG: ABC transporter substrate-binding protein [Actinomycetes bacterium]
MHNSTRVISAAAAISLVAGLALTTTAHADSTSPSPSAAAPKVVFTIGLTTDMDSANPFTGLSSLAYEVFQMQYPLLTQYGAADFSPVPGLAESWTESADKKSWTYKIRPGLTWTDGQPLTAKDAAYTFNRIINGEYEKTNYGSYIANITKAEAPDDTTLILSVSKPTPIMEKLYVYILPEHVWKSIDEKAVTNFKNEGTPASPSVGGGSFYMVERRVGQFIRMDANPNFYRGKPPVDEIIFKIFKNDDAMGQALKKGEIDFAEGLGVNVLNSLKGVPGITTVSAAPVSFNEIAFNTGAALADGTPIGDGNPLLKDKALRRALAAAIDKQTLVDKVLGGDGIAATTVIPPVYATWHLDPANLIPYDPALSKTMLDAAGYKIGADGVRVDSKGKQLSFRLVGRSNDASSKKAVEFVKNYLAAVGVEVTTKMVSEDSLYEIVGQGTFDMFEWGWGVEPDPNYMLSTFSCANRSYKDAGTIYANLSDSFYCNPEYDKLLAQQSTETNQTKRQAIVMQMQQMLYDDSPYVMTYYYSNHEAYRSDRFTGFVPQPAGNGTLILQWGTWSYEKIRPVVADVPGETPASDVSATNLGPYLGVGLLVIVIVGGLVVAMRRRRPTSQADNEE